MQCIGDKWSVLLSSVGQVFEAGQPGNEANVNLPIKEQEPEWFEGRIRPGQQRKSGVNVSIHTEVRVNYGEEEEGVPAEAMQGGDARENSCAVERRVDQVIQPLISSSARESDGCAN